MHDNLKIKTLNTEIINNIYNRKDLEFHKTEYGSKEIYKISRFNITLTFIRAFNSSTGEVFGFRELWINYNPHKIFNNNQHNGNDFPILDVIVTHKKVFDFLSINKTELKDFSVISFEYGCNVPFTFNNNDFIDNLLFHKNGEFTIHKAISSKIVGCKDYKQIKIYDKTKNLSDFGIFANDVLNNTIRYEIKCKKEFIQKDLGIYDLNDLINPKTFEILIKSLIKDLDYLLITENVINKIDYEKRHYKYLLDRKSKEYWIRLLKMTKSNPKFRNRFRNEVKRYNSISNLKIQFDDIIKNKLSSTELCDFLAKDNIYWKPHLTPLKFNIPNKTNNTRNCENLGSYTRDKVQDFTNNVCKVTGLLKITTSNDKILNHIDLEYYYKFQPLKFELLKFNFLEINQYSLNQNIQITIISQNIKKCLNKNELKNNFFENIDLEKLLKLDLRVTESHITNFNH